MHEIERKAHHEAAHACLHLAFAHPVQETAISENGGHCRLSPGEWTAEFDCASLMERQALIQYAVCACGGRAVMDKIYGYKPADDRNWRASDDRASAFKCCLKLADGDEEAAEHLLAYALRRAEILVRQHWGEIERVAYGLLCYERLTGDQVREIIERTRAEQAEREPVAA